MYHGLLWRTLAVLAALGLTSAQAQDQGLRDSRSVQQARNKMSRERETGPFYAAKEFNLDDLPPYVAEEKAPGTIRLWGSNYFTDGNLGKYWEKGSANTTGGLIFLPPHNRGGGHSRFVDRGG